LQKLQQQRPLSLRPPLGNALIQIGVQVGLLEYLTDNVSAAHVKVLALCKLCVLDSLLPQREFKHFNSLDEIVVDVFLGFEVGGQLIDFGSHLLFLK